MSKIRSAKAADSSGAVDEQTFRDYFDNVDLIDVSSTKELKEQINQVQALLSRPAEDWEKRCSGCKLLRSIAASEDVNVDEMMSLMKPIDLLLEGCCKDLRSQVVREACICVSYMSETFKNKFSRSAEVVVQQLVNLIPNSAKIMATSGIVALKFVVRNISTSRLLQLIASNSTSKSAITRRHVCEIIGLIVSVWPAAHIEKNSSTINSILKKGISDADQEARAFSRTAALNYIERFPPQGASLMQILEPGKKRELERLMDNSNAPSASNSQTSLNSVGLGNGNIMKRPKAIIRTNLGVRKNSEIIPNRSNFNSIMSNSTRGRKPGKMVSQSQPASRDVSPTPSGTFSYLHQNNHNKAAPGNATNSKSLANAPERRASGIQRSLYSSIRMPPRQNDGTMSYNASREPSPTRSISSIMSSYAKNRRTSVRGRASIGDGDFTDAASFHRRNYDNDDAASETSSICSDKSSRGIPGYRKLPTIKFTDKIDEIFSQLNANQWSDKKSGLANLQTYLKNDQVLNHSEIRQTGQLLIKMFNDSQCKQVVLQLMETLQLLMKIYSEQMLDLLYQILIKLLNKQGQELISSHQKAISETLFVVRSSFPLNSQIMAACRFANDSTLTPNFKVKAHFLNFFKELIVLAKPSDIKESNSTIEAAIGKIILWTQEPKSNDVRRLSARVIIKLNDLNPKAFSEIVQKLSQNSQDQANKVLKTYQKNLNNVASSSGSGEPNADSPKSTHSSYITSSNRDNFQKRLSIPTSALSSPTYKSEHSSIPTPSSNRQKSGDGMRRFSDVNHNSNSNNMADPGLLVDEISKDLNRIKLDSSGDALTLVPQQSSQQVTSTFSERFGDSHHPDVQIEANGDQQLQQQIPDEGPDDQIGNYPIGGGMKKKPIIGYQTLKKIREIDSDDFLSDVLEFLSEHNEKRNLISPSAKELSPSEIAQLKKSNEHRDNCLYYLADKIGKKKVHTWDEHFKPMLLILLETLGDNSIQTRIYALKALRELIFNEMPRFQEFIHLTLMKLLESCLEEDKRASQIAEQCLIQMLKQLHPPDLLDMLLPLMTDNQNTIFLDPVMRFINLIVNRTTHDDLLNYMPKLNKPLNRLLFNEASSIRKRTVDCYVNIHSVINEELWAFVTDLPDSKIRLIKVFIEKRNHITNTQIQ